MIYPKAENRQLTAQTVADTVTVTVKRKYTFYQQVLKWKLRWTAQHISLCQIIWQNVSEKLTKPHDLVAFGPKHL